MENQEQQAENERREEKKRQEKFRRMQQKVEMSSEAYPGRIPTAVICSKRR